MAKSVKREFSRYIKSLEKPELEKELKKLFDKIPAVSQYYELELSEDTTAVLEDYKAKIRKEYFPNRGYGNARSSVSKKYISDFKRISVFPKDVIELLLYRTEMMIDFTNLYGDMEEPFYTSLVNSFGEACKMIRKENLEEEFKDHCIRLIDKTEDLGWGVSDGLWCYFQNYIDDEEEEEYIDEEP